MTMVTPARLRRRLLLAGLLVVASMAALVVSPTFSRPALAYTSSTYYHTLGDTAHADWMRWVSNQTSLGNVSMPGTHETLSIHGGTSTQTQEDYGDSGSALAAQLNAGIRALDLRVAGSNVPNKIFAIYHGLSYQNAAFGDVLRVLGEFLAAHPTETVLMRVKAECTGDQWSCTDAEGTDNTVRMGIFNYYRDNDEYAKKY